MLDRLFGGEKLGRNWPLREHPKIGQFFLPRRDRFEARLRSLSANDLDKGQPFTARDFRGSSSLRGT